MGAPVNAVTVSPAPADSMPAGEEVAAFVARASLQVTLSKKPPHRPYTRLCLDFIDAEGRRAGYMRPVFLGLGAVCRALNLPENGLQHGEDLLALSGAPVRLSVVHNPGANGVTYANVTAINGSALVEAPVGAAS